MVSLSNQQRIALAFSVPIAAVLYILWMHFRRDDDGEAEENVTSLNKVTIEIQIPQEMAGLVIGRGGATIKKLQQDSGARIMFRDGDKEAKERFILVRGERENVEKAENLIRNLLAQQPKTYIIEVLVPKKACGRIIGKGGNSIREMCRISGAKIAVDRTLKPTDEGERKCLISGTAEQIEYAKALIKEKIAEDEEARQRNELSRKQRMEQKLVLHKKIAANLSQVPQEEMKEEEKDKTTPIEQPSKLPQGDGFFEVCVSAMESPGKFWVQVVTTECTELDKMVDDMTADYSSNFADIPTMTAVNVNSVCAAPFEFDDSWYRAQVTGVKDDGSVEVFYLDFGDSGNVAKTNLKELRTKYKSLPFQAFLMSLANIRPKDAYWSDAACMAFEKKTYCAEWKVLMAKVVKYVDGIPCIDLVDTTTEQDINIGEELVKSGYAVYDATYPSSANDIEAMNQAGYLYTASQSEVVKKALTVESAFVEEENLIKDALAPIEDTNLLLKTRDPVVVRYLSPTDQITYSGHHIPPQPQQHIDYEQLGKGQVRSMVASTEADTDMTGPVEYEPDTKPMYMAQVYNSADVQPPASDGHSVAPLHHANTWHGVEPAHHGIVSTHHGIEPLHHGIGTQQSPTYDHVPSSNLHHANPRHGVEPAHHGIVSTHGIEPLHHGIGTQQSPTYDHHVTTHGHVPSSNHGVCSTLHTTHHGISVDSHGISADQHGISPAHHGVTPIHHGVSPAHHGIVSDSHGFSPGQHGISPVHHGITPAHHGIAPAHHGLAPAHGITSDSHGVPVSYHGVSPAHHGFSTNYHGLSPAHHEVTTAQHGLSTTQHGLSTTQHGISPAHHGVTTAHHGLSTTHHGLSTTQHGISPAQHGLSPAHHGVTSAQHGLSTTQHGLSTTQHGISPAHHGLSPAHHGVTTAQPTVSSGHHVVARDSHGVAPAYHGITSLHHVDGHGISTASHGIISDHGVSTYSHGVPAGHHGLTTSQHGIVTSQHGLITSNHGINPDLHGVTANLHGVVSSQHGISPAHHGIPTSHHVVSDGHSLATSRHEVTSGDIAALDGHGIATSLYVGHGLTANGHGISTDQHGITPAHHGLLNIHHTSDLPADIEGLLLPGEELETLTAQFLNNPSSVMRNTEKKNGMKSMVLPVSIDVDPDMDPEEELRLLTEEMVQRQESVESQAAVSPKSSVTESSNPPSDSEDKGSVTPVPSEDKGSVTPVQSEDKGLATPVPSEDKDSSTPVPSEDAVMQEQDEPAEDTMIVDTDQKEGEEEEDVEVIYEERVVHEDVVRTRDSSEDQSVPETTEVIVETKTFITEVIETEQKPAPDQKTIHSNGANDSESDSEETDVYMSAAEDRTETDTDNNYMSARDEFSTPTDEMEAATGTSSDSDTTDQDSQDEVVFPASSLPNNIQVLKNVGSEASLGYRGDNEGSLEDIPISVK